MNMLIIENNQDDLIDILALIDDYNEKHKYKIQHTIEYDYNKIIEVINNYDFVLMDIELDNGVSGIDLASEIRKYNRDVKIILVSNYSKYLIDGYKSKVDLYWLKPVAQNVFDNDINDLAWDYFYHNAGIIDTRYASSKFYFHNILYIEKNMRKLYVYFKNGDIFICKDTLLKWEEMLKECPFSHSHRSYLINMEHVDTFNKKEIKLTNGAKIQMTENYFIQFQLDYIRYLNRRA